MKLYTELQMREAMFELYPYADGIDKIMDSLTPIKLPSDEEIGKKMDKLPFSKHVDDGMYNDGQLMGFELGVDWIKEQILNQNK